MTEETRTGSRLDALEIRVAHQDAAIEELNGVLTRQWAQVDKLLRQLALLEDRLGDAEARAGAGAPQQPPPHY